MTPVSRVCAVALLAALLSACVAAPPRAPASMRVPAVAQALPAGVTGSAAAVAAAPVIPAAQPRDLWRRIREGLALPGCDADPRIVPTARSLVDDPQNFEQMLAAVRPLMSLVQDAVEVAGIPSDFTLLPLIESTYRPDAIGPGGYAGLWQFDRGTALAAGMPILAGYDGRRDPWIASLRATRMLARYDHDLHDWRLVVWAFNRGEWGIRRLYGQRGQPPPTPALPDWPVGAAARGYLLDLMAYACVFRDPARFDVTLPPAIPPAALWLARFDAPIAPALAARLADVPLSQLRAVNAGYLDGRMPADAPLHLLLPRAVRQRFLRRYAMLTPDQWRTLRPFRLRATVTLDKLLAADSHADRTALARGNDVRPDTPLRPGRILWLPAGTRQHQLQSVAADYGTPACHVVQAGGNLWSLARRYGVSVQDLRTWNHLHGSMLRIGQRLCLRTPG
jgi:membrane-bound lytic murein transglycosylase D